MRKLKEKVITDETVILIYEYTDQSFAECASIEIIERKDKKIKTDKER